MGPTISIIRPSSNEPTEVFDALVGRWSSYNNLILPPAPSPNSSWPYVSASTEQRSSELNNSLRSSAKLIMCARGGYGASDLLDNIDFSMLSRNEEVFVCGFSDASALISAFYANLGWRGIHCPMPFTKQFLDFSQTSQESSRAFERILEDGSICTKLNLSSHANSNISGPVFGGNLAVLTNLIGTPYIPKSLNDHILIFEDISEAPARIVRFINQWKHSGLLKGIKALVLGDFSNSVVPENCNLLLAEYFKKQFDFPIFCTHEVGHGDVNLPFVVGELASISGNTFKQDFIYSGDRS